MSACAALALATIPASAATLDDVKARGHLKCGIEGGLPGFSAPDDKGQMRGMDADFCYALTAAIFGDKTKVKFTNLTAKERFTALTSGEIDVLSRNTTATMSRGFHLKMSSASHPAQFSTSSLTGFRSCSG